MKLVSKALTVAALLISGSAFANNEIWDLINTKPDVSVNQNSIYAPLFGPKGFLNACFDAGKKEFRTKEKVATCLKLKVVRQGSVAEGSEEVSCAQYSEPQELVYSEYQYNYPACRSYGAGPAWMQQSCVKPVQTAYKIEQVQHFTVIQNPAKTGRPAWVPGEQSILDVVEYRIDDCP